MILKIILDSSLDENEYKNIELENQTLFCTVKSVNKTDYSTRFTLDSAFPYCDEITTTIPIYASVIISQSGIRFFADYGPEEYIDVPCKVEQVDSSPGIKAEIF